MKPRIFFCGEALIDFITADGTTYRAATGGAPFNAAKAAAMADAKTYFCGAISDDIFGKKILADLRSHGVNSSFAERSSSPTVLGFIQISEGAHPSYAFFDRDSSMVNMNPTLEAGTLRSGDILGIGSISLIPSPGADRIEKFALHQAQTSILALDPNVRPSMIRDRKSWHARLMRLMEASTIIKISFEDLEFFAPDHSPEQFAKERIQAGSSLVIVTDGEKGSEAWTPSGYSCVKALKSTGGDTVGAGDTMMGYVLAYLAEKKISRRDDINQLDQKELYPMLNLASVAAAMNCEEVGCHPPSREAVEDRLEAIRLGKEGTDSRD